MLQKSKPIFEFFFIDFKPHEPDPDSQLVGHAELGFLKNEDESATLFVASLLKIFESSAFPYLP
jgi:hypothetical protein